MEVTYSLTAAKATHLRRLHVRPPAPPTCCCCPPTPPLRSTTFSAHLLLLLPTYHRRSTNGGDLDFFHFGCRLVVVVGVASGSPRRALLLIAPGVGL